MTAVSAHRVLESAAEVTSERDRDCLRESLLRTIGECLPVRQAQVIRMSEEDGELPPLLQELREWFGARPDVPPFRRKLAGGITLLVLPLRHGQPAHELLLVELGEHQDDEVRLLRAFARLYANFIDVLRDAEHDRLTGLQNRRSFDARMARLVEHAPTLHPRDSGRPRSGPLRWWLALLDVDHFKKINDGYGHLYGDEVLLLLSRILKQSFRGDDRCYRYGGEEFAVMLGAADADGARGALERLRMRVEHHPFPQVGRVTVSIGCAALEPGSASSEVIERADKALYYAKGHGRNRVACYDQLEAAHVLARPTRKGEVELF